MLRGCQKKMIYLRNTGSDLFEEAFFVIKPGSATESTSEKDMVIEARRILNADRAERGAVSPRYSKPLSRRWKIKFFLLGIICAVLSAGAIWGIIWLI